MHTSALAFQMLKLAGVAYLFYLAWATWRDRSAFAVQEVQAKVGGVGFVMQLAVSER